MFIWKDHLGKGGSSQEDKLLLMLHSLGFGLLRNSVIALCPPHFIFSCYESLFLATLLRQGLFNPTLHLESNECQLNDCRGRKPPSIQGQSLSQPELWDQPASCCFSRPHLHLVPQQVSALMQLYVRALRPISPMTIQISTIPGHH